MALISSLMRRVAARLRLTFFPTRQDRELARWHADRGDELLRLDYPLSAQSLVFDLGGYKGQWASDIFGRFACRVLVFEPIVPFADAIQIGRAHV